MSGLVSALRLAVRSLLARPTFFLAAVATLALGICALAAIYSVYDAVLLRPLPFAHAERIVEVTRAQTPIRRGPVARQVFEEWRDGSEKAFEAFGAYSATTMNLTGAGDAARLTGYAVTPGFWEVFGHPLALGRAFGAEEERSNERVVVLSNAVWRNRFDASETIIGRQVLLNGESYRVTGVGAAGLAYPMDGEVWLPTYLPASTMERGSNYLNIVARLRPGVGPEEANLAMAPLTAWQAKNWPDNHMGMAANVEPLQAALTGAIRQPLAMLLIGALLVLLIACANLANLMLARGQAREREFAVHRALGADARRVMRSVLAEAMVISAAGTLIGLLAARPAIALLTALAPSRLLPATSDPAIDLRIVAVIIVAGVLTLFLAGLVPAWRASRIDPADALRGSGRDTGTTQRHGRLRAVLVSAEIALALTLLSGSALLIQSLRQLSAVDAGVASADVLTARIALPKPAQAPGEDIMAWVDRIKATNAPRLDAILARIDSMPGASSVAVVDSLPISGQGGGNGSFSLPGHDIPMDQNLADFRLVSPDYFATLGIPLRAGRVLDAHDGEGVGFGTHVLVNQAFVDRFVQGKSVLGQQIGILDDTMKTIVGVVGNARQFGLDSEARPEVYFPARGYPGVEFTLAVKVDGDALAFAEPMRRALAQLAPDVPVYSVRTMDEATRTTTLMRRFNLTLMSIFATVALLLAAIGLYGVVAYTVAQRRREIGLRQALGASTGAVHRLMLRAGLAMIVPGILVGLLGALALGRVIAAQLYGVQAADPVLLGAVVVLLSLVALAACAIPTLRAARIAPMEALRDE